MDNFVLKTLTVVSTEKKWSYLLVKVLFTWIMSDVCSNNYCNILIMQSSSKVTTSEWLFTSRMSEEVKVTSNKPWKQFGITNTQVKKVKICQECMKVWTALIIPLFKSDSQTMRKFLRSQAISGAILKFSQLHDYYLFNMHQMQKAKLEVLVKNRQEALIVNELSDDDRRYVLDVFNSCFLDFIKI